MLTESLLLTSSYEQEYNDLASQYKVFDSISNEHDYSSRDSRQNHEAQYKSVSASKLNVKEFEARKFEIDEMELQKQRHLF